MSKVSVFDQKWIDLVFEGRNKAYGAYKLRQQQSKTTIIALFSGIGLILALVSIPAAINYFNPAPKVAIYEPHEIIVETSVPVIFKEKKELKVPDPIIEEPQKTVAQAPKTPEKTIAYKQLKAVTTTEPTIIPTTEQVTTTKAAAVTSEGDGSNNFSTGATSPLGKEDGTGTGTKPSDDNGTVNATMLDEAPEFPGGMEQFYKTVGKRFNTPEVDVETTLRVYVSFVVEKDGTISHIKVLRDPGYGAGKEAIRVLESIKTKWKPGKMRGQTVRSAYNLPITINIK
ncbi:MAG: hypothetical protein BM557_10340 [Flavobacterium sp. MedPE-SWcel]|uniref:energy transducer TonB n=1 Tax=uncultured Flavobacterium sp. TaxID=165435 RepID=UPI0009120BB8|nr:energy transducer TonB [uncultured Flavobacterium sp.]OIQ16261.1 MAG: hypothetical protein BM557_10340 [Flavobacterium sp. MedPE-SWcel]